MRASHNCTVAILLFLATGSAFALDMPTGDLTAMRADPATIRVSDPFDDEPKNPAGRPTGFNITEVLARRVDNGGALEIGVAVATCAWDADGNRSVDTTDWPMPETGFPTGPVIIENREDLPLSSPYWMGFEKEYTVMVLCGNATIVFVWRTESADLPKPFCSAYVGGTSYRIRDVWAAPFRPMCDGLAKDVHVLIATRNTVGDQLAQPLTVYVMCHAGNFFWPAYDHTDMAMLKETP